MSSIRTAFTRVALILLSALMALTLAGSYQTSAKAADDDLNAIKLLIAGFVDDFNRHDAHATAMWFADDADFMNAQQSTSQGRQEVEVRLVGVFKGRLKNAHRTYAVKSIRFLTPEVATIAMTYELAGTMGPNDIELPMRKGIYHWVVSKHGGKWLIDVLEEAEIIPPATAPAK